MQITKNKTKYLHVNSKITLGTFNFVKYYLLNKKSLSYLNVMPMKILVIFKI